MQRNTFFATVLILSAGLSAQAYLTAPPNHLNDTGGALGLNYGFFFMDGRAQTGIPKGFAKGNKVEMLEVAYRVSTGLAIYTTTTGMGRKFKNMSLQLGHTSCASFQTSFSANYKTMPSSVFSSGFSLPTITGRTHFSQRWRFQIKFNKKFVFNGSDDLLMEWTSTGGKLDNGRSVASAQYYLDGCPQQTTRSLARVTPGSQTAPGSFYLPRPPLTVGPPSRCADSSFAGRTDAYTFAGATIYGDAYRTASLRGKIVLSNVAAYGMARSAPYVGVVTLAGSHTGSLSSACRPLYADLSQPVLTIFGKTDSNGSTPFWLSNTTMAYDNNWAGTTFYAQSAWNDSKSGNLSFTIASKLRLPRKPHPDNCPLACLLFQSTFNGSTTKPFRATPNSIAHSVMRFRTK